MKQESLREQIADPDIISKLETVEHQLTEAIRTLCAVEALAEAWRELKKSSSSLLQDSFMFSTVYDALWDSLLLTLGRIWDNDKRSASLPTMARALFVGEGPEAVEARLHMSDSPHKGRERLRVRRHKVVAHRDHPLPETFDSDYAIDNLMARKDVAEIMERLHMIADKLGRPRAHWGLVFTESREDARKSLERWRQGYPPS